MTDVHPFFSRPACSETLSEVRSFFLFLPFLSKQAHSFAFFPGLVFSSGLPSGDNSTEEQVVEWNNCEQLVFVRPRIVRADEHTIQIRSHRFRILLLYVDVVLSPGPLSREHLSDVSVSLRISVKLCDPTYNDGHNYCQNRYDLLGCSYSESPHPLSPSRANVDSSFFLPRHARCRQGRRVHRVRRRPSRRGRCLHHERTR